MRGPVTLALMPEDELAQLLAAADMSEVGPRIRQARVTRGMTQEALAGGDVSIGYVSRIESGKRRPDAALLARLAERLHLSPLVLLSGVPDPVRASLQVTLDHAELALRGGSAADAEQQLASVWADLMASGHPDLERRARLTRALTREALGRLDDAIIELEDLWAAGSGGDAIQVAVALSRCYRESGDLTRAVETGERQLERLRGLELDGSDAAVQLTVTMAAAYFERGDVAHAVRLCRRAIERAEELGSPLAKASAYWNASVMESHRGAVDAAVPLAASALRHMESAEDNRNLARLHSALGSMQLRLDPPRIEEARTNLETAGRQYEWSSASRVDVLRNALSFAQADLLSGDIAGAETRATAVLEEARGTAPILCADALLLLGRAAAGRDDADGAARHYREAVLELSSIGSDRAAAGAWYELGALLEELGLERDALQAYRSAAASTGLVTTFRRQGGDDHRTASQSWQHL